jgi:site-specific recombinase XerD
MDRGDEGCPDGGGGVAGVRVTEVSRAGSVPGLDEGSTAAAVLARAGVRERQVFVLAADGSYDVELNRFFRELDAWGVRAANSVSAYARDIAVFCRFLEQARGGKSIWACDAADLAAFKRARLRGDPGQTVSVRTWRRSIAALDKWAAWAKYEGLVAGLPFRYADKTVWTPNGLQRIVVNTASEPDPGPAPVRFMAFEDYLTWRDVGLAGRLPDGRPDPSWRGLHDERNCLFADLLIFTGMRLGEAASLLVCEMPGIRSSAGRVPVISLAEAVTKRSRARAVFPPSRLVRSLRRYESIERGELAGRLRATGRYRAGGDTILVRRAGQRSIRLADGPLTGVGKLDPLTRRHLMGIDESGELTGPLALWLGDDGLPLRPAAWQAVFTRASERCATFGLEVRATPHLLRHSFAVHMLGLLLRQTVAALGEAHTAGSLTSAQVKRLLVGNPMRKLQLLLGHRNEATVYTYLDVLDEAQEIVASALEQWETQAAVPGQADEHIDEGWRDEDEGYGLPGHVLAGACSASVTR